MGLSFHDQTELYVSLYREVQLCSLFPNMSAWTLFCRGLVDFDETECPVRETWEGPIPAWKAFVKVPSDFSAHDQYVDQYEVYYFMPPLTGYVKYGPSEGWWILRCTMTQYWKINRHPTLLSQRMHYWSELWQRWDPLYRKWRKVYQDNDE